MVYRISKSRKTRTGRGSTVFAGMDIKDLQKDLNRMVLGKREEKRIRDVQRKKVIYSNIDKLATWARNNPPYKAIPYVSSDVLKGGGRDILKQLGFENGINEKMLESKVLSKKVSDRLGKATIEGSKAIIKKNPYGAVAVGMWEIGTRMVKLKKLSSKKKTRKR